MERTRAFVKVQDGCSFYCTYCIIPRARGPERSLEPRVVLADVRRALAAGHREVVLTGINIGTYDGGWSERGPREPRPVGAYPGRAAAPDPGGDPGERVRLSSIEPQHVDEELLAAWADGAPRMLPHLHLPLQSGDDGVLRAWAVGTRLRTTRRSWPGRAKRSPASPVHADVIAGFPTEDRAAF